MGPTACLPKARCLRLEPYALKGACTVLRGGGEGNLTSLPSLGATEPTGDLGSIDVIKTMVISPVLRSGHERGRETRIRLR